MYPNFNNYYPQSAAAGYPIPQPGLKGRPVSSLEEARAANIDFDGSLFVFPDVASKRIYTKQINLDGTANMKVYAQVEDAPPAPAYVTRAEFDDFVNSLKQSASKEVNNESNVTKSNTSTAITF